MSKQVLLSTGIEVELHVVVCVDNVGAIFMAENVSTSPRAQHVDIYYYFVRIHQRVQLCKSYMYM